MNKYIPKTKLVELKYNCEPCRKGHPGTQMMKSGKCVICTLLTRFNVTNSNFNTMSTHYIPVLQEYLWYLELNLELTRETNSVIQNERQVGTIERFRVNLMMLKDEYYNPPKIKYAPVIICKDGFKYKKRSYCNLISAVRAREKLEWEMDRWMNRREEGCDCDDCCNVNLEVDDVKYMWYNSES